MDLISKGRRLVIRIVHVLGVLLAMAALVLALLSIFQRRLIYLPFPDRVPAAANLLPSAQEVTFSTADGLSLHAWFVPASGSGAAPSEQAAVRRPGVIVFNGNAGNRAHRAPLAEALSQNGLSVLLFDYRGYGDNEGSPTEEGLRADALAARHYLASRDDVDPGRVVYFGESLGAAVALSIAKDAPAAALVLRSPFTSLTDVAAVHYPYLPVRLLLRERYPSLDRIREIDAPVLIVAADNDEIVPFEQSRRLYEAAREPKHLAVIPGVGHNDPEMLAGPRLVGEMLRFFGRTVDLGLRSRASVQPSQARQDIEGAGMDELHSLEQPRAAERLNKACSAERPIDLGRGQHAEVLVLVAGPPCHIDEQSQPGSVDEADITKVQNDACDLSPRSGDKVLFESLCRRGPQFSREGGEQDVFHDPGP